MLPPGRVATQASSQISKPMRMPPQSKIRSPMGYSLSPILTASRIPAAKA